MSADNKKYMYDCIWKHNHFLIKKINGNGILGYTCMIIEYVWKFKHSSIKVHM